MAAFLRKGVDVEAEYRSLFWRTYVASVLCAIVAIGCWQLGWDIGWDMGYESSVKQTRKMQSEHNATMRKMGFCRWAEIMAERWECKGQPVSYD
jgi:hypothetical protein